MCGEAVKRPMEQNLRLLADEILQRRKQLEDVGRDISRMWENEDDCNLCDEPERL